MVLEQWNTSFDTEIGKPGNSNTPCPSLMARCKWRNFSALASAQHYITVEFLTSPRLCIERSAVDWVELARLESKSWVFAAASFWLCRRSFTTQTQKRMAGSCSSTRFTSKSIPVETGEEVKMVESSISVMKPQLAYNETLSSWREFLQFLHYFLGEHLHWKDSSEGGWQKHSSSKDTWRLLPQCPISPLGRNLSQCTTRTVNFTLVFKMAKTWDFTQVATESSFA